MMLVRYFISIIIWGIMIFGTVYLFEDKIRENGWLDGQKSTKNPWLMLFFMSAIPLLRLVFFLAAIMMVGMTKEQFEELKKECDNEQSD